MRNKKSKQNIQTPAVSILQRVFTVLGPLAPSLMGRLVYKLWFTTHRIKTPSREQLAADGAQKSTIDVDGIPIKLWTWGEQGPIILFIHGWSGRATQVVKFIDPLVESGYRVISFDAPAHGETPGGSTDIFKLANALSSVIQHLGNVHGVITHSIGAMVLGLVYHDELNISKISFIAPAVTVEVMVDNFQRILKFPDSVRYAFMKLLKNNYGKDLSETVSLLNKANIFQCKTLVIHDEDDEDLPWKIGEDFANRLPNAQFIKTQGLGHVKILYDQKVANYVKEFLSSDNIE